MLSYYGDYYWMSGDYSDRYSDYDKGYDDGAFEATGVSILGSEGRTYQGQ